MKLISTESKTATTLHCDSRRCCTDRRNIRSYPACYAEQAESEGKPEHGVEKNNEQWSAEARFAVILELPRSLKR